MFHQITILAETPIKIGVAQLYANPETITRGGFAPVACCNQNAIISRLRFLSWQNSYVL